MQRRMRARSDRSARAARPWTAAASAAAARAPPSRGGAASTANADATTTIGMTTTSEHHCQMSVADDFAGAIVTRARTHRARQTTGSATRWKMKSKTHTKGRYEQMIIFSRVKQPKMYL